MMELVHTFAAELAHSPFCELLSSLALTLSRASPTLEIHFGLASTNIDGSEMVSSAAKAASSRRLGKRMVK